MNKRMNWDAGAAFKSLNAQGKRRQASIDDERLKTTPYTPPPAVAAWLKAQADKSKAGRDIESLMRYHEAHKKGRTDDDCLAEKFGKQNTGVGNGSCPKTDATASKQGVAPLAPTLSTPPQSADGGQPLPSAVTKPHGKDVDTADGSTPLIGMCGAERLWFGGMEYIAHNRAAPCRRDAVLRWWQNIRTPTIPEMYSWLEQNGHKDVAAQLRGKDATGGGRAWKRDCSGTQISYAFISGKVMHNNRGWRECDRLCVIQTVADAEKMCAELFGPERDAILSECRKAMGLK